MEKRAGLTIKVFETAAELLAGVPARVLAERDGVSVKAIYERRRVAQNTLQFRLPSSQRGRRPMRPLPTHEEFSRQRLSRVVDPPQRSGSEVSSN